MSISRDDVNFDVQTTLSDASKINDVLRACDYFDLDAISKTLSGKPIKRESFDFFQFLHSDQFDVKSHLKPEALVDIWVAMDNTFAPFELNDESFLKEIFTWQDDLPRIRKAIIIQAVVERQKAIFEFYALKFLQKSQPTAKSIKDIEDTDELHSYMSEHFTESQMFGKSFKFLVNTLTATQVAHGYLANLELDDPYEAKRTSRTKTAVLDVFDIINDPHRLQIEFARINLISLEQDFKVTYGLPDNMTPDDRKEFDWVKFLYSGNFDPTKNLGNGEETLAGRVWAALSNAFPEEDLAKWGFTREAIFSATVTPHLRVAILFYVAVSAIESKHAFTDAEETYRINRMIEADDPDVEKVSRLKKLNKSAGHVITSGKALNGRLELMLLLLDQVDQKQLNYQALSDKQWAPVLPFARHREIVEHIEVLHEQLNRLDKNVNKPSIIGFFKSPQIDLKRKKLHALTQLLRSSDLKGAYDIAIEIAAKTPKVMDGETGKIINGVIALGRMVFESPASDERALLSRSSDGAPAPKQQVEPSTPSSTEQSPVASPKISKF